MISNKVLVAVPTMGAMHPNLVASLLNWSRGVDGVEQVSFRFTFMVSPVDRARNEIVKYFLNSPEVADYTHILFVDSDTVPPVDAIKRLISHNKDIVSGLTPILHHDKKSGDWVQFDNCFTHFDFDDAGKRTATHMAERHTGLQPIIRCGSSCVLIKKEVFSKVPQPYYQFLYNEDGTTHIKSEDINFCDKAREAGIELFADTDVICRHYKVAEL